MRPFYLFLTALMIFTGFILMVIGCVFGYTSMNIYWHRSDQRLQLLVNLVFSLIIISIGGFLLRKGVKLFNKKN